MDVVNMFLGRMWRMMTVEKQSRIRKLERSKFNQCFTRTKGMPICETNSSNAGTAMVTRRVAVEKFLNPRVDSAGYAVCPGWNQRIIH
jgi:hypothetical protein